MMIYYGRLGKAFRDMTRFHVLETYPQESDTPRKRYGDQCYKTPNIALRSGDRIKVFNSIAAGNALWKGTLRFLKKEPSTGANPMGMPKVQWEAMFNARLPVRLTRENGEIVEGMLNKWNDWDGPDTYDIFDFKNNSYQSLHNFKDGDVMEIFSGVTDGNVVWEGEVKTLRAPVPSGQQTMQADDDGVWRGKTGPEYVGNALVAPSIRDVRTWQMDLPVMLERDEP
ncbi:MAG: hypothetical protein LRZ85_10065 [Alphaproteobacteria bacterium]|nr:hypothetical protein [Alphaproteobacteria bacterium]